MSLESGRDRDLEPALDRALRHAAGRVRYHDERVFEWGEKAYEAPDVSTALDAHVPPAVREVARRIYDAYYCMPDAGRGNYVALDDETARRRFMIELDEANATTYTWRPGWRLVEQAGARCLVKRADGSATRWFPEDQVLVEGARVPGAEALLRARKGSGRVQPPWYHVYGERDHARTPGRNGMRVYWNIAPGGASPLVRTLTRALNEGCVPFHFKILTEPDRFTRADAGVLYLPADAWRGAAPGIARAYEECARWMKRAVPLFTRPLAPGLAAATDPDNDSFGMSRSRLVAWGLWNAHLAGVEDEARKIRAVSEAFRAVGLDLARPYLGTHGGPEPRLDLRPQLLPFQRR